MAKQTKTELENNAEKYQVGKGSITYKPNGYSLSKIITVGEIIPDEIIENYKRQNVLEKLLEKGTIVLCGADLEETKKEYVKPPSNASDMMNEIADKTSQKTEEVKEAVSENKEEVKVSNE
ncbi:hypothetical protein Q5M87_04935 [Brachyspira innocens]|uniref:Phage protein n=1 Tax=Brachyspira innocens TaxID=13264 RepID=A0ABT8YU80_9SPIR|nr:hypothetical protein [Brachyspira innocens]MDO6993350.1 hypothetical protein [Brachyspira innocens]MDO7019391.1 hypothetical protein [Brachyspira innocens]